jgi:hypothetical protein
VLDQPSNRARNSTIVNAAGVWSLQTGRDALVRYADGTIIVAIKETENFGENAPFERREVEIRCRIRHAVG